MGDIFLARQRGIGGIERFAIVKTLRSELANDAGHKVQFLDEARVAAMLNHPNVVATWDMGDDGGVTYIAMEYVAGVDVLQLQQEALRVLGDEVVPAAVSAAIIRDVARGLDYMHHAVDDAGRPMNIVHRDISPQNLMVRNDGIVKVVDFGLARSTMRQHLTANSNTIKGKLAYMSPEQAAAGRLDGRSDQYSLGVVFWELLARRARFQTEHPMAILLAIGSEDVPPPSSVRAGVDPALDVIVGRMLARNPNHRFARMGDVADALGAWLQRRAPSVDVAGFVQQVAGGVIQARVKITPTDELALPSVLPRVEPSGLPAAQSTEATTLAGASSSPSSPEPSSVGPPRMTPGAFVGVGDGTSGAPPLAPLLAPIPRTTTGAAEVRVVVVVAGQFATPLAATAATSERQARERAWLHELAELATSAQGVVLRSSAADFVVVFGVRAAGPDDGVRALRFALHLAGLAERQQAHLACAIDSGAARVVREGRLRVDGAVVDRAGALASRAATTAQSTNTWATSTALRAMRDKADVDAARVLAVPGFAGDDALSGVAVRGLVDAGAAGACVGRDDVLRGLVGVLASVEQGTPAAVVISSEPGGGRSRVLREVQTLATARGAFAVRVVVDAGSLVVDVARALARALATVDGDAGQRLRARATALGEMLDPAGAGRGDGVFDPQQGVRLLARLQALVIEAAALRPLVLFLDDDDDRDGRAVAGVLLRLVLPLVGGRGLRLGAVVAGDPDVLHAAFLAGAHHVALPPLDRASTATVARSAVDGLPLPVVAEEFVLARAHGNPDLALQLVRALVQAGLIERTAQGVIAHPGLETATVPAELGLLLHTRVERLDAVAQTVLAVAAVVDGTFSSALVAAAAGLAEKDASVDGAFAALQRQGFLESAGSSSNATRAWRFVSTVTRETVLGLLPEPQRAGVHARLYAALQADGDLVAQARRWPALAMHAEAAGYVVDAGLAWAQVARLQHRGGELDAAASAALHALALVEGATGTTGATPAVVLSVAAVAVVCLTALDPARAVATGERVSSSTTLSTATVPSADAVAAQTAFDGALARALLQRARHREADERLQQALQRPVDVEARAGLLGLRAQALEGQGRLTEAIEASLAAFHEMGGRAASDADFYWSQLNVLGRLYLKTGDAANARTCFAQAEEQAGNVDSAAGVVKALANRAVVHAHQGEFDAAHAILARALTWAEDAGDLLGAAGVHFNRARLFADQSRFAQAQESVDVAAALAVQIGWSEGVALTSSLRDGLRRAPA